MLVAASSFFQFRLLSHLQIQIPSYWVRYNERCCLGMVLFSGHVWYYSHGTCMVQSWYMYDTTVVVHVCMVQSWYMYMYDTTVMVHVWYMYGTVMVHVCMVLQSWYKYMYMYMYYWVVSLCRVVEEIVEHTITLLSLSYQTPNLLGPISFITLLDPKASWFRKWMVRLGRRI